MKGWFRSREKELYRMANGGLLVCMTLFGAERSLGIDRLGIAHFAAAFAVLGVLAGVHHMAVRGRLLCLAGLFLSLCAGSFADSEGSLDFWRLFFRWLVGRGAAPGEWELAFGLLQTALIAAACYGIQILFERLPGCKQGAAVLLLGILIFCLLTRREMNHFGMAFMICFFLLTWQEWVQSHWEKRRLGENSALAYSFRLLPFMFLYLLFLLILPAPEKPYDWGWAKAIYHQLRETVQEYTQRMKWENQEGFGMAFTGFSEEGALGGNLQEEAGEVMRVQVKPSSMEYLYLTGGVYDTFDGRGWSERPPEVPGGAFLDAAQTLYAVRSYNERYQRDYLKEIQVTIRYEDFNTGYVFAPLKTWSVEEKSGTAAEIDSGDGTLRWNVQRGFGTEYNLRYFALNTGQPQFDIFLEDAGSPGDTGSSGDADRPGGVSQETGNQKIWQEVSRECERDNGISISRQNLEDYERAVCEQYLGEVKLSEEVESALQDIVGAAETELEKLRAIEKYLSTLHYTLIPGKLPKSIGDAGDFLDYFLLESRQGYCTYFATAFVLLARAEGIPARYVQGYCVPIGEQEEAVVVSQMAHAWPEAYFEGVGWIPFEPTPGYGSCRYDPWRLQQPPGDAEESMEIREQETDPEEDEKEEPGNPGALEGIETTESGKDADPAHFWGMFGSAAWVVLLFCGTLLVFEHMLGKYRYRKKSPQEQLRMEALLNIKVLSLLMPERESWETLEEFREKSRHQWGQKRQQKEQQEERKAGKQQENHRREKSPEERKGQRRPEAQGRQKKPEGQGSLPLRFIEDYEEVIYGGKAAGEEMVMNAVRERAGLLEILKQERRWGWIYCKIRLYFGRYRF